MKASHVTQPTVAATNSAALAEGAIEGHHIGMLVDTGSALMISREDVWNVVEKQHHLSLNRSKYSVVVTNGEYLELMGEETLEIEVGGLCKPHRVLVAKHMTLEGESPLLCSIEVQSYTPS